MSNLKLDLHVHTIYSGDSLIKPADLIKFAKLKGLDGFAICDHGTLKAYKVLKKDPNFKNYVVVPGVEIETHIGEIIGLFIEDNIMTKDNNFFSIIDNIKEHNGLIVIPHPFDFLRNNHLKMNLLNDKLIKKYINGIEIINSRIILKSCVKKASEFNEKYHLFETGGSDAHTKNEIGNSYTLIKDALDFSCDSVKKCLMSKQSKSVGRLSSPLVHLTTVMNKLKKGLYF